MGRVAKYKKVKSFDPYSKKNHGSVDLSKVGIWGLGNNGRKVKKRSKRAEQLRSKNKKKRDNDHVKNGGGFDLPPPMNHEDEFDLHDLVGSIKKQKVINPHDDSDDEADTTTATTATTTKLELPLVNSENNNDGTAATTTTNAKKKAEEEEFEEKNVAKILKLQEHDIMKAEKQKSQQEMYQRQVGESKNAYRKRTKNETRQIIQQSHMLQHNPEKRLRKKEFLTNKKKQKKSNSNGISSSGWSSNNNNSGERQYQQDNDDDYDSEEDYKNKVNKNKNDETTTRMVFGEQVERPPVFRQLPRGATTKKKKVGGGSSSSKKRSKYNKFKQQQGQQTTTTKTMTEDEIDAESHAMDLMRRKIQVQYAAIKSARRQNGDFHL